MVRDRCVGRKHHFCDMQTTANDVRNTDNADEGIRPRETTAVIKACRQGGEVSDAHCFKVNHSCVVRLSHATTGCHCTVQTLTMQAMWFGDARMIPNVGLSALSVFCWTDSKHSEF